MSIISSIPFPNFIDGVSTALGAQVNANNESLIEQVNANAAANGANADITSLSALTAPPTGLGSNTFTSGVASGTANTIVIGTTNPTGFSFVVGDQLTFIASAPPTGAVTVEINGDVQVLDKWLGGSLVALTGGEWATGQLVTVTWDGTRLQLVSPYQASAVTTFYIGEMRTFCFNTAPALWLACSGQAISRSTYAALFAAIGTTFGAGNGTTTFNIPNMNGQFQRGFDFGGTVDPSRTFGSTQGNTFADHVHLVSASASAAGAQYMYANGGGGGPLAGGGALRFLTDSGTGTAAAPNNGGTETRPTNVALLFAIYAGV